MEVNKSQGGASAASLAVPPMSGNGAIQNKDKPNKIPPSCHQWTHDENVEEQHLETTIVVGSNPEAALVKELQMKLSLHSKAQGAT